MNEVEEKIAKAKAEKSQFLDLGNCGLNDFPQSIFELACLNTLLLGPWHIDTEGNYQESKNNGKRNQISTIHPEIGRLGNLRQLKLRSNRIENIAPLADLRKLTILDLDNNHVTDLSPLKLLSSLVHLNVRNNKMGNVDSIQGVHSLIFLDLENNQIENIDALRGCLQLQQLYLRGNSISNIQPLSDMRSLVELVLRSNHLSDITPISTLIKLRILDLENNRIPDVTALTDLKHLTTLKLSNNQLRFFPSFLLNLPQLLELSLFGNQITNLPIELLGRICGENCLHALRTHFADKRHQPTLDCEMKLILLGNGRVGKTSLTRQLIHNEFDQDEISTHGIRLERWNLPVDDKTATINVWDFGGQDIYHGTHALFLKSQAIFLIVWDKNTEQSEHYTADGLTFENYPLRYWLDYVNSVSPGAPVIVIENKCDDHHPSMPSCPLDGYQQMSVSAAAEFNITLLREAIRELCRHELAKTGQREMGIGRWNVKQTLRDYLPREEVTKGTNRAITQDHFRELCEAQGEKVSDWQELLKFLHNTGTVFYQEGLFNDQIIIDQRWAIEAIYTIFHREECYQQLQRLNGRFRRLDLDNLVWGSKFNEEEQKLFISFMESCSLCFQINEDSDDEEPEYIAPALLPRSQDSAIAQQRDLWHRLYPAEQCFYFSYEHAFLHAGVMQQFITNVGRRYRESALYWQDGVLFEDKTLNALAEIQCIRGQKENRGQGRIQIEVRGQGCQSLLQAIRETFSRDQERQENVQSLASVDGQSWIDVADIEKFAKLGSALDLDGNRQSLEPYRVLLHRVDERQGLDALPPATGSSKPTVYFSYAWNDEANSEREAIVDEIEAKIKEWGIAEARRDKNAMIWNDSINAFIDEIGQGRCIVVVLCDKYLRSPFCMAELVAIYHHSCRDPEQFLNRICPLRLEEINMSTYSCYWEQQRNTCSERISKDSKSGRSTEAARRQLGILEDIASHCNDLLTFLQDRIQRTPEQLRLNDFAELKQRIYVCIGLDE